MVMGERVEISSQSKVIEPILHKYFPNGNGYFIEIGAWDGELISQTYALELAGWKGICVDPFPRNFENRTCLVVPYAITGTKSELKDFVKVTIDRRDNGDVSYFSGFRDNIDKGRVYDDTHSLWDLINNHCDFEIVKVKSLSVKDFFEIWVERTAIDFLSIDTEGSEYEIISNLDFFTYSFGFIMYEHNNNIEVRDKIRDILRCRGYSLHKETNIDDIFINDNL